MGHPDVKLAFRARDRLRGLFAGTEIPEVVRNAMDRGDLSLVVGLDPARAASAADAAAWRVRTWLCLWG